ncbi:endospore germination permease [Brevibacillus sp. B_LB10_24]|uniref:GerAB/ArcD/ProY family transporter n=1 Tax=Brevibacillus sp. B_LB10_24 TaxID=3380645 RepID=UPI0038B9AF7D
MTIEKGRISAFQMGLLMLPTILVTALLLLPSLSAKQAGRDMWISPMWGSLIGFLTVYIVCRLNKLYPKQTLIEYSETILGRIPGKILGFCYVLYFLYTGGLIVREYTEFVVGTFYTLTPMIVVAASIVLAGAYAVAGGLEVLGRCGQIFVPLGLILQISIVLLLIPDLKPAHMLPIMEHGIGPSLKGSVVLLTWFSEFVVISFMLPYLTDRVNGFMWGTISVFVVLLFLVIENIAILFLFGDITPGLVYPFIVAARYISLADFFEHVEAVVMAIWVTGAFVKITVFYYVLALAAGQWLELPDYRPLVLPLGFLLVVFSVWSGPTLQQLTSLISTSLPFLALTFQIAIPLLLLAVALIREKTRRRKEATQG